MGVLRDMIHSKDRGRPRVGDNPDERSMRVRKPSI
jgi:hypothetical protein